MPTELNLSAGRFNLERMGKIPTCEKDRTDILPVQTKASVAELNRLRINSKNFCHPRTKSKAKFITPRVVKRRILIFQARQSRIKRKTNINGKIFNCIDKVNNPYASQETFG